jgi:hypothetical protein
MQASLAPHDENEEPIYPGTCRPASVAAAVSAAGEMDLPPVTAASTAAADTAAPTATTHWRFRVPDRAN